MNIQMQACRNVLNKFPGYSHLERTIFSIEHSLESDAPLVFDLSRAFIESVCKTVLNDIGVNCDSWGMDKLINTTCEHISLLPTRKNQNQDTLKYFRNIVDKFNEIILNISNLRHEEGISSHGKDGAFEPLELIQAAFIAGATDVVASFILNAHFNYRTITETREIDYEDYKDENEIIDSENMPFHCYDLEYLASYTLYSLDKTAYKSFIEEIQANTYEKDKEI